MSKSERASLRAPPLNSHSYQNIKIATSLGNFFVRYENWFSFVAHTKIQEMIRQKTHLKISIIWFRHNYNTDLKLNLTIPINDQLDFWYYFEKSPNWSWSGCWKWICLFGIMAWPKEHILSIYNANDVFFYSYKNVPILVYIQFWFIYFIFNFFDFCHLKTHSCCAD